MLRVGAERVLKMQYSDFLSSKRLLITQAGLDVAANKINRQLYFFQKDVTRWALKKGRSALFCDCGLGKTPMQLEWANHVCQHSSGNVLILAPLAVSQQTVREGLKFGIEVNLCRSQEDVRQGINITNYEILHKFQPDSFAGVVLDESSILKSYDGKTRTEIIEAFAQTPFRLACTATPAPNDYMELGNHAEFLGVMSRTEMLATFFVHDGGDTSKWRLKGHAEEKFWEWVASWSVVMRRPSDLGYDDGDFVLPQLNVVEHVVESNAIPEDSLFVIEARTLEERRKARQATIEDRVVKCAEIASQTERPFLVWCDLNRESELLAKAIPGAVEIRGSDSPEQKEKAAMWFMGEICKCQLKSKKRICENGPKKIQNTFENTKDQPQTIAMHEEENFMHKMPNEENRPSKVLVNGERKTQEKTSPNGLNYSGLPQRNTTEFSQSKEAVAQYVGIRNPQIGQLNDPETVNEDCMLTTVIKQEWSEGSYVQPVTLGSENSMMAQKLLSEQLYICGEDNKRRILISKPSIFGFGLNFQHCADMAFVGLSDSYEAFYQAVRRCWRFGQKREVNAHVIISDQEGAVADNIKRKEADAQKMQDSLIKHTQEITKQNIRSTARETEEYERAAAKGNGWTLYLGDCVEIAREIPDNSIHYSVFSPPFASLYTYTNSERDMGNCRGEEEFLRHFKFLVVDLYRLIMPGRLLSFHCMNLPTTKSFHGYIGIHDFRGDLIKMFQDAGFIYHSEVCIWKDPVTAMQRTKALGLLHKQLKKDSCMSRQGIPDYLVTMRKPGDNPERVSHTNEDFPVSLWQRYASPIWMDINPSDTLQKESAREHKDEKHICPLQLEVIERATQLWTNPGDLVLSPFAGIGSEGYVALKMGRRFIGIELKQSYWKVAKNNLEMAADQKQLSLFPVEHGVEGAG